MVLQLLRPTRCPGFLIGGVRIRIVYGTARGGGEHLIETLQAHIAASGNLSATARALHLSARAVGYRLERIAQLTGHSPHDPEGRFVLELAVRARPLIAAADPQSQVPDPAATSRPGKKRV